MEGRKWKPQWTRWRKVLTVLDNLDEIRREQFIQKIRTYVGSDLYVMKRNDFSAELKDLPAFEALDLSNYPVLQTSLYFRNQFKKKANSCCEKKYNAANIKHFYFNI